MADSLTQYRAGSGPPLVLLHGLGFSWRSWQPVLALLEPHHDVIAIDLPGFGNVPALDGGRASVGALADAVALELDRLGLERPALAGNSLGGWIALELAARRRTGPVVALAPAGLESPAERAFVIAVNAAMRLRARALAPFVRLAVANPLARALAVGALHGRPWRMSPELAAGQLADFASAPGFHPTLMATEGAAFPTRLGTIDVPVRIAFGTRDLMLGALTAPRYAALIPGAELVALPGAGHVPMCDDPALVGRTVLELTAGAAAGETRALAADAVPAQQRRRAHEHSGEAGDAGGGQHVGEPVARLVERLADRHARVGECAEGEGRRDAEEDTRRHRQAAPRGHREGREQQR
jgi:pimeloyl-ACP methyl ester carboxylesterase